MSKKSEQIKFKELIDGYTDLDPMDVDITYIEYICDLIPDDGYVDMNSTEQLTTLFLKGANHCADLLSKVACYCGYCESEKRSTKASAIQALLAKGQSGTVAKEMYGNNPEFIEASNNLVIAEGLLAFIERKRDSIIKAHHWFKDLSRSHKPQEGAANWESSSDFGKDFHDQPEVKSGSRIPLRKGKQKKKFKSEVSWDEIEEKKK